MGASSNLHLYPEPWAPTLDCEVLAQYIRGLLPSLQVEVREPFLSYHLSRLNPEERGRWLEKLAQGFARAKVRNLARHEVNAAPLYGEIAYERGRLEGEAKVFGLLYDGVEVMSLLAELIAPQERSLSHIHVVFTNQLFGTWEDDDRRYHARVSLYGFPSLISTTGLVEAPAKPREFYFLKQQYTALGMADAIDVGIKEAFQGRVLEHGDQHLTEVLKGYLLQALFYHLWGEPFCSDRSCRLYNAHWQEEVLQAQLSGASDLCPHHRGMLEKE
ncbi:MAG: hypothetical protein Q8P59_11590 [Dehalococcoidia bacterium]|nr:hypothetical protein [Dehalococcoidia bacterium]